ncbi:MAG TPA: hypothetical protein VFU35_07755 [Jatrophihabitans sp.]|nr:hypothetical protein [Jatrophihabitans sp.]
MTDVAVTRRHTLHAARTRGVLTGLGLMLLGAWGAIIPFVGPYFDYAYTPNTTWTWTAARFFLQVLPGVVTFFAGLVLVVSRNRVIASFAGWCAVVAGIWFVIGSLLAPIWQPNYIGSPVGGTTQVAVERIGIFYGLGAVIVLLAGFALGRFSVVGVRDVAAAERRAADREQAAAVEQEARPASPPPSAAPAHAEPEPAPAAPPAAAPAAPPAAAPAAAPASDTDDGERHHAWNGFRRHHGARAK